jgi:hypothetical protein
MGIDSVRSAVNCGDARKVFSSAVFFIERASSRRKRNYLPGSIRLLGMVQMENVGFIRGPRTASDTERFG